MAEQFVMPEFLEFSAICHIEQCENFEIPIPVFITGPESFVICGPCGTQILDLQELTKN